MPQRTIQSNNSTSKKLKAIVRQQSQHKPKVEKSISHKDVWVRLLSNELNSRTHKTPIKFLRELYWQKHCQLRLEGTETVQEEKKPLDPRSSTGRKQAKETMELQTRTVFHGNGRMTQVRAKSHRESFLDRSRHQRAPNICPTGLQNFCEAVTSLCLLHPSSPFEQECLS